jgi:hypothetical protein
MIHYKWYKLPPYPVDYKNNYDFDFMHVKEDTLMSSCFLQVLIRILGNEVVGTYIAMIFMGTSPPYTEI